MNAPRHVYERGPGDRMENPATDADMDPVCDRPTCHHVLNARRSDVYCVAGHRQNVPELPELRTVEQLRARTLEHKPTTRKERTHAAR